MDFLISSKVSEVVVYPDRARLTAMAELDLDGGNHKIIVDELPLVIIPESVRVSGQGTAQVQIGSVDVRRSFYERTPVENVREIEDKIQELNDERKVLADEESIFQAQGEYLEGLRRATLEYAKGIARGKTNIEDYARLSEYLQENDRSLRASIRKLDNEMRDLDVSLEKLNRELNELYAGRSKQGFQVVVDVAAEAAGKFTLQIIYLIRKSAWRPLYDMRLTDNEDGKKLDITVLAEIKQ
ncbi:MAG TPA: mucoidy inhibitor MuiA family protein, partial [candidate division Zixibacteria bacterium]|nr:mucoidy inhibitor MuiA family protein [candidate division Zixibacteria bacterium]